MPTRTDPKLEAAIEAAGEAEASVEAVDASKTVDAVEVDPGEKESEAPATEPA